jgi:hypothetical protein
MFSLIMFQVAFVAAAYLVWEYGEPTIQEEYGRDPLFPNFYVDFYAVKDPLYWGAFYTAAIAPFGLLHAFVKKWYTGLLYFGAIYYGYQTINGFTL